MNRKDRHARLIASESYWFGGVRDVPKVYETGTRHHIDPLVGRDLEPRTGDAPAASDYYEVSVDLRTGELSAQPALPA